MIIVSLHCQMGNQMFQYALGKAYSKHLSTLFIPYLSSTYYPFQLKYFKLDMLTRLMYNNETTTKISKKICRALLRLSCFTEVQENQLLLLQKENIENNVYYSGFFQSDYYFKCIQEQIKKKFTIKRIYQEEFKNKYSGFNKNKNIVVHIRRTDYVEVEFEGLGGKNIALPLEYYHKALASISDIEDYRVIFIGDDIDNIQKDFLHKKNYFYEKNSAIVDFQLIQNASIAIIANSTFAWWAAYLNENENKRIIAPKYWLGHKVKKTFPAGIENCEYEWIIF